MHVSSYYLQVLLSVRVVRVVIEVKPVTSDDVTVAHIGYNLQ